MRRIRTVLAAAFALAMLGTACGSSAGGSPSGSGPSSTSSSASSAALIEARTKTTMAGSSRIAITVAVNSTNNASSGSATIQGTGAFDFAQRTGSMDMSIVDPTTGQPLDIPVVFDSSVIYEKLPAEAMQGVSGGPWLKIDLKELSKLTGTGLDLSSLTQGAANDPSQVLGFLLGASSGSRVVGHEQVRGTDTTHYSVTTDLNKAAGNVPSDQRAAYEGLIKSLGKSSVPMDVWIDSQGRARRIAYSIDVPAVTTPSPRPATSVTTTTEYYDFGVPVTVTTPPPSEVTDLADLLAQSGQGGMATP